MRGYPCLVVSDNGTDLTSNDMLNWQEDRHVECHYIAPGKPMHNGFVVSFYGRMGDERKHPAQAASGSGVVLLIHFNDIAQAFDTER